MKLSSKSTKQKNRGGKKAGGEEMKKNRVTKTLGWKQEVMTQLQLSKLRQK